MPTFYKNPTTGDTRTGTLEQGQDFANEGFVPVNEEETISAESLKPNKPIELPDTPVDINNYKGIIEGGQASSDGIKTEEKQSSNIDELFSKYLGSSDAPPSLAGIYGEEYGKAGIGAKEQEVATAQQDLDLLNAQMKGLVKEAQAVPIQLQQESEGRGVTAGGVKPIETKRLRDIALKSLPLEAQILAKQAILTGNQNALKIAQDKLSTVFKLREADATNQYNYNRDLRDKIYNFASAKEQARIDAMQQEDDRKFELLKIDLENATNLANTAMENGQPEIAAQISALDPNSPTYKQELFNLQSQIKIKAEDDQFTLSEGAKRYDEKGNLIAENQKEAEVLTEKQLLDIEAKKLDIQQKIKDLSKTGLDTSTQSQVDKISSSFDSSPIVKNFNEVQNKKLSIDAIVDNGVGGPADLALVFEFMKALDPTSVVRESEYAAASSSGNIFKGWAAKFNGYLKAEGGTLPEEVKQEFKRLSGDKFDIITRQYDNLKNEKARLIDMKTGDINGSDYLVDYNFTKKSIEQFNSLQEWVNTSPSNLEKINQIIIDNDYSEEESLQLINRIQERSFSKVDGDTNIAILNKVAEKEEGDKGGQCGRFVNNIAKLGVGNSFNSKMAKMDKNINIPEAGMVFTMPYKNTGHCGIILSIYNGIATVKDSNWSLDEKIKTHKIPVNKMTGFARA